MSEVYFPAGVFKNILDYCGKPLPENGYGGSGYGWVNTKVYYRQKNGNIAYRIERLLVKCKNCGCKYGNTGYNFCSDCYKNNLVKDYYKKYEGKNKENKILSYSIMKIETPIKDVKDIFYSKFNFDDMKLTSLEENDNLKIIAVRSFKTKFGDNYIILTDDMKMYMSNKKITNYINNKFKNLDGIYYRNNVLFCVDIGQEDEYNGHKYNEIKVY